ncbi:MAG: ABC transporter permease [Candidatus Thermoplasmatota archaeon]|nr:ABC transporter permease [Candidatus Thermoplasmatota archaeon]
MATPAPEVGIKQALRDAFTTKAGIVGGAMLGMLIAMVIVVPIYAPGDVIHTWGDLKAWTDNPRTAAPEWMDYITPGQMPRNMIIGQGDFRKQTTTLQVGDVVTTTITLRKTFDYQYDGFPSELTLFVFTEFGNNSPLVSFEFTRPDGETLNLFTVTPHQQAPIVNNYYISKTGSLPQALKAIREWATTKYDAADVAFPLPEVTLFAQGGQEMLDARKAQVLKGEYSLLVRAQAFSSTDELDGKFIVYGHVHGLAGTDNRRRDLMTGILWGAPVALAFGVLAAFGVVLTQTILGAISGWYGGRLDELIQRAADFTLVLPLLPVLILISLFYTPSIWILLIIVVGFGIVGSTTKVIRSLVLQIKEEQFIESAQSYGASRVRILFKHIFPRVMPYTFALIALAVPSYIFLEASLGFLGLADPILPTWGNLMGAAQRANAIFNGYWWWIAIPAAGIVFTTVAFALLGYAFDKVLNPRLRER